MSPTVIDPPQSSTVPGPARIAIEAILLSFVISWLALLPFVVIPQESWTALLFPFVLLAKFGPSIAGVIVAARHGGERGVFDLFSRLRPPKSVAGLTILALSILAPIPLLHLSIEAGSTAGVVGSMSIASLIGVYLTKFFVGGGMGEELGWRGVVLPNLQRVMHPSAAALLLGVVWALWHLPAFYVDGADKVDESLSTFISLVIAFSIVFSAVYNLSGGNLLACVSLHAMINASEIWATARYGEISNFEPTMVWWIVALVLLVATRGRLGYRGTSTSP